MTYSSSSFTTYNLCPSNRKIKIANGSFTTFASQGTITLFPSLPLENALHVPKLSINLLFVHQVTKDLDYRVTFYPTYYVFQDRVMGRMIRHAKENDELYFLETQGGNSNQPSCSYLSNNISFNTSILDIHHLVYSKICFLYCSKNVGVNNLHCDICKFAKHHHVSFPLSNTSSLIHSNI